MTLHDQRVHAATLFREIAKALYTGKPCADYMPKLREATQTVARVAEHEVVIALEVKKTAEGIAR